MSSAWIYQDDHQVKKHGKEKASHYVGWISPQGKKRCKSCGPGQFGLMKAQKLKRKIEAELMTGTYQEKVKTTWEDFCKEYAEKTLAGLAPRTRLEALTALEHFERIVKPVRVYGIQTNDVDGYIAARRKEPGKKKGDCVSPATINKELRHVKAALRVAEEWGYLATLPRFHMEKEPGKLPTYITGDHFAAVYQTCDHARMPHDIRNVPAADWWRALLVTGYMTGWRISDMLGLRREDLDLDAGTAITRWQDNKGKRDERVKLHPVVIEHLRKIVGFDPRVFPWNHERCTLMIQFAKIQEKAGIHLPCHENHEHTRFCHVYGFHDLRRAFATMNADKLTGDALQVLMRHKSYETTKRYINMARQMDEAVANLHVPDVLKTKLG
jgi:integrase